MQNHTLAKLIIFLLLFFTNTNCLSAEKIIYVTSDDGPLSGTENIREVANSEKIPITLFMVGKHCENFTAKKCAELTKSDAFIEIANHSYSHANNKYVKFYSNAGNVIKDFKKNNLILNLTGKHISARMPGRNVFRLPNVKKDDSLIAKKPNQLETLVNDELFINEFYIYGWDLEWRHENNGSPINTPREIGLQIENKMQSGKTISPNKLILLMHDQMFQDKFNGKSNLKSLIKELREKNYQFAFVSLYDK